MRASLRHTSCFDEKYLAKIVSEGVINEVQKKRFVLAALKAAEIREGDCSAEYWKKLCPEISRAAAARFARDGLRHCTSQVRQVLTSTDGRTKKLVIALQDGAEIEACIIIMGNTKTRATLCVSSQIGCRMGCLFCATGTLQLKGNLNAGEIIEQFVLCYRLMKEQTTRRPLRNVVFMGMGEPLDNYQAVIAATTQLLRTHGLAGHQITISTVGHSPQKIRRLITDAPNVSLALSLHAPNEHVRRWLIPSSVNTKLATLLEACSEFVTHQTSQSRSKAKRNRLLVEYCLIKDVNDSLQAADELSALLEPMRDQCIINLIPYNPTDVANSFQAPTPQAVHQFSERLTLHHAFEAFVRQECGQDVAAACGQLALTNSRKIVTPKVMLASALGIWTAINIVGVVQLFRQLRHDKQRSLGSR